MNFFYLNQFVILLQCFFFFDILDANSHRSLVITIRDDTFEFTKPIKYNDQDETAEFKAPEEGNTYHFCPSEYTKKNILLPVELIKHNDETSDINRCKNSNRPVIVKVKNAKQLKTQWNDDGVMELYHCAYMLCVDGLLNEQMANVQIKPRYESLCTNIEPLLGMEFFFHKNFKQTVAVGYKLIAVSQDKVWTPLPTPLYKSAILIEDPDFLNNLGPENSAKFLKKILGDAAENYLITKNRDYSSKHAITAVNFAPNHNFLLPLWDMCTRLKPNLFPMWRVTIEKWNEVTMFSEKVAASIGNLMVTAGTTGIMQLLIPKQDEANTSSSKTKASPQVPIPLDDGTVRLPNYAWKIFEYNYDYGILVVINCNPFIPTEKICKIDVCETNGWKISNSDFSTGEIYCCNMTDENIQKLNADFLSLSAKKPFVLKSDSKDKFILVEN